TLKNAPPRSSKCAILLKQDDCHNFDLPQERLLIPRRSLVLFDARGAPAPRLALHVLSARYTESFLFAHLPAYVRPTTVRLFIGQSPDSSGGFRARRGGGTAP